MSPLAAGQRGGGSGAERASLVGRGRERTARGEGERANLSGAKENKGGSAVDFGGPWTAGMRGGRRGAKDSMERSRI